LSAAVFGVGLFGGSAATSAQEAATAPGAAAGAATTPAVADKPAVVIPADTKLSTLADDFMHYTLVNNSELAKANGQAIIDNPAPPEEVVAAFESTANGRVPRDILLQAIRRQDLREVGTKLLDRLEEGYRKVARDPQRIRADVDRLNSGPRAYQNAKDHLAAAGQFAVPIYIEYLQNPAKKELQPDIIRVMGEIGRPLLLPLIEALRTGDNNIKIQLVNVIGQIGYPQALPTLRAIQTDSATTGELKIAVDNAIRHINIPNTANLSAAELNLYAAENYYQKKPSYQPLLADEKTNPIWVYDTGLNNVVAINVPTPIWNSVMALRLSEAALKQDANNAGAISLWLASNLRREIQLPQGATDPTRGNGPDASFYALAFGPIYINPVLGRALDENDAALALRAIDSLEATGGSKGLVSGGENAPLVRALAHPDRSVRFRAAFALARANPESQFPGFYRVVPILAEAVNSTGSPTAIVVGDENTRNKIAGTLREGATHYTVYAANTLSEAIAQASRAPAVDVIVLPNDGKLVGEFATQARTNYRLTGSPVLVAAPAEALPNLKLQLANSRGYGAVDVAADDAALTAAIAAARAETGAVPLDAEKSAQYSATAIDLLGTLAADHHSIYNVTEAVPSLSDALHDKRPEIATGAARDLGRLNSQEAQRALATAALAGETDPAMRVVYLDGLAESAKRTGLAIDAPMISNLIKLVTGDSEPKVKLAAAKALGALNVPSNQASTLILQQAR